MKKTKLKLGDLKVQSFVTSMEKQEKQTVDGGASGNGPDGTVGYCCRYNNLTLPAGTVDCDVAPPANWCTYGGDGYEGCIYMMYC